jgi:hypothetical protein
MSELEGNLIGIAILLFCVFGIPFGAQYIYNKWWRPHE